MVAATLNVGSMVAAIIAGFVEQRADDLSVLLLMAGFLANVVAGFAWLVAGVTQWSSGRGLAVAYVVAGGGFSAVLLSVLLGFLVWSGV